MRKVIISETSDGLINMGEPGRLVEHGGSWTQAIGRLFQGDKEAQTIIITHTNGLVEKFYLKEME